MPFNFVTISQDHLLNHQRVTKEVR